MNSVLSAVLWIGIYLALVLAPLTILLTGPRPPGSGFWWDLSMAIGFAAVAMLGVQFVLTARFKRATAPFGIDILYYFHRTMAIIAFALVSTHYLIIRAFYPDALGTINPLTAPGYMTFGRAAFLCFTIVIVTSIWRKPLHIPYYGWRLTHVLLTTAGLIFSGMHIEGVDYYHEAPGTRLFWIAFVSFWVLLVVYVRLIKPWRMRQKPYRVLDVKAETTNTWTLAVQPEGHAGLRFQPGQFSWLTLRASPFALKEHPFSISSSAERPQRLEFTIKDLGDFTHTVSTIAAGEMVWLDGPYGAFSVDRYTAPGFVFIAGGVGIAPIMSMLRTLADRQDPRPLWLVYASNRQEGIIFLDTLEALKARLTLRVVHVLAQPPADWQGECGLITQELLEKNLPENRLQLEYFLCGPKPMMQCTETALHALRIPLHRVHSELFDLV
jgi:predicted ferric reductase